MHLRISGCSNWGSLPCRPSVCPTWVLLSGICRRNLHDAVGANADTETHEISSSPIRLVTAHSLRATVINHMARREKNDSSPMMYWVGTAMRRKHPRKRSQLAMEGVLEIITEFKASHLVRQRPDRSLSSRVLVEDLRQFWSGGSRFCSSVKMLQSDPEVRQLEARAGTRRSNSGLGWCPRPVKVLESLCLCAFRRIVHHEIWRDTRQRFTMDLRRRFAEAATWAGLRAGSNWRPKTRSFVLGFAPQRRWKKSTGLPGVVQAARGA